MTENLPTTSPAETLTISPEALEVANCYLQVQSIREVALNLDISPELVSQYLGRREVKAYIDHVFMDIGFNNQYKMRSAIDAVIKKKFQEMQEADTGSTKDITEILALSHKMTMDVLDRQIKLEQIRSQPAPASKSQVNVQINNEGSASNYDKLLNKLMGAQVVGNA